MSLSPAETQTARQALREIREYEYLRKPFWWLQAFSAVNAVLLLSTVSFKRIGYSLHDTLVAAVFLVIWPVGLALKWKRLGTLRSRQAPNLQLLEKLRVKSENDIGGFRPETETPLLAFWTRRLPQRALLWRVDAFLSGKRVSD